MTCARASLFVAAIAMTAVIGVTGPAYAAFEIVGDPNQPNRGNSVMVDGFGRDLPVEVVAEQVVPPAFAVSFGADVNRNEITSWQGGRDWRSVLGDSLAPLGLTFTESDRSILITRSVQAVPAPGAMQAPCCDHAGRPMHPQVQPMQPMSEADRYAAAKGDMMMQAPAAVAPMEPQSPEEWVAAGGSTLKNTLVQWADRAGWAIAWQSERDYRLEASATFYGDF